MAYSDFTASTLITNFNLKFSAEDLFSQQIQAIEPSTWLLQTLEKAENLGFTTEKARSERLITPILMELSTINQYNFTIYSGMILNANKKVGLVGECDFICSFSSIQDFINAPIFNIVEAKKQDIEGGTIQCAAQLVGSSLFNEQNNSPIPTIYGASTTGTEWRFLKLEGNNIIIDRKRYYLANLPNLLGALQLIIQLGRQAVARQEA